MLLKRLYLEERPVIDSLYLLIVPCAYRPRPLPPPCLGMGLGPKVSCGPNLLAWKFCDVQVHHLNSPLGSIIVMWAKYFAWEFLWCRWDGKDSHCTPGYGIWVQNCHVDKTFCMEILQCPGSPLNSLPGYGIGSKIVMFTFQISVNNQILEQKI